MARLPYENWLYYLLKFSSFKKSEVYDIIEHRGGFPRPSPEEVKEAMTRLKATKPDGDCRKGSRGRIRWVRQLGLLDVVHGTRQSSEAFSILDDVSARSIVELLLATNTPLEDIQEYLSRFTGRDASFEGLELYRHLFWDSTRMTSVCWRRYVDAFMKVDRYHGQLLGNCIELRSPEFALWKLGHRVEIDRDDMLKSMFHEAGMRFMETTFMKNGQGTSITAKNWSDIVMTADERMNAGSDKIRQALEELKNLQIRLGNREISSADKLDLAGKNKKEH
jgi:hypothetical protein